MTRGVGKVGDFQNPQRAILTFLNSEFCIFPMNLVVLAQDFQNQICFIAKGILSWFSLWHYIHTCIPKMTLKFCNNFYLQYYKWEENKGNQEGSMIQFKKESWLFVKSHSLYKVWTKSIKKVFKDWKQSLEERTCTFDKKSNDNFIVTFQKRRLFLVSYSLASDFTRRYM